MSDTPRFKSDEEMEPGDWIEFERTGRRPERPEYRQARSRALKAHGLEPDHDDDEPKELEDMSPEDHARSMYPDTDAVPPLAGVRRRRERNG